MRGLRDMCVVGAICGIGGFNVVSAICDAIIICGFRHVCCRHVCHVWGWPATL